MLKTLLAVLAATAAFEATSVSAQQESEELRRLQDRAVEARNAISRKRGLPYPDCSPELLQNYVLTTNTRNSEMISMAGQQLPVFGPNTAIYFEKTGNDPSAPYEIFQLSQVYIPTSALRNAFRNIVKSQIPGGTCQNRYKDHNDYAISVSSTGVRGGNTITYEHWKCVNVLLDEIRTRIFKTTASQYFNISAIFNVDQDVVSIHLKGGGEYAPTFDQRLNVQLDTAIDEFNFVDPSNSQELISWDDFDHGALQFRDMNGSISLFMKSRLMEEVSGIRRPRRERLGVSCQAHRALYDQFKLTLWPRSVTGELP